MTIGTRGKVSPFASAATFHYVTKIFEVKDFREILMWIPSQILYITAWICQKVEDSSSSKMFCRWSFTSYCSELSSNLNGGSGSMNGLNWFSRRAPKCASTAIATNKSEKIAAIQMPYERWAGAAEFQGQFPHCQNAKWINRGDFRWKEDMFVPLTIQASQTAGPEKFPTQSFGYSVERFFQCSRSFFPTTNQER